MQAAELATLLILAPDEPDHAEQLRLITGAIEVLDEAIALSLDVCDAVGTPGQVAGTNLPELLREALTQVAERLPEREYGLIRHRPGSWEATHVRALGQVLA